MKLILSLSFAFALNAQITATLNHLPDGTDEVWLRNDSMQSLTAFVVSISQNPITPTASRAPMVYYSDPLTDPLANPLGPGERRKVIEQNLIDRGARSRPTPFLTGPVLAAAVMGDGSTSGDPTLLTYLNLRRSNLVLAVDTTLETLSDAGRRNVPRSVLIDQFEKLSDSLNRWYLPPEQQVGLPVYQSIIGKLASLPDPPLGVAFPPDTFVAHETAILRQQRIALLDAQPPLADAFHVNRL